MSKKKKKGHHLFLREKGQNFKAFLRNFRLFRELGTSWDFFGSYLGTFEKSEWAIIDTLHLSIGTIESKLIGKDDKIITDLNTKLNTLINENQSLHLKISQAEALST